MRSPRTLPDSPSGPAPSGGADDERRAYPSQGGAPRAPAPAGGGRGAVEDGLERLPQSLVTAAALAWRVLLVLFAFGVVLYVLVFLRLVTLPVVLALFAATILAPPTRWLHGLGMPRGLAAALVVLLSLLIVGGLLALVVPPIVSGLGTLGTSITEGASRAGEIFGVPEPEAAIDRAVNETLAFVQRELVNGALITAELLAGLLLMIAIAFLFLKDGQRIWDWIVGLFPVWRQEEANQAGQLTWRTLGDYIRGTALVALVDTTLVGLSLLMIGVPLVLPLAVLIFLAAFFPLVGIIVAGTVAILVTLVFLGPVPALVVASIILAVHLLEGNFLYPVIAGRSLHLHPLAVLLAITTGSVLAGPVGAFLSIPLAASAHAVFGRAAREGLSRSAGSEVASEVG